MKQRFQVENFYTTTLTGEYIIEVGVDGTLPIQTVPTIVDGKEFFVILSPLISSDRQVIRCYVDGGQLHYYGWSVSFNKTYGNKSTVSINDVAELFNILYNYVDDFGYIENTGGLTVRVAGGRIYKEGAVDITIPDTNFTLADNTTTYVYVDDLGNQFATTIIEPISYFVCAKVVTLAGDITQLYDYRPNLFGASGGTGGGHRIENIDQSGVETTLPQRDSLTTKKIKTYDDDINLTTVLEGKRIATPDYIPVGETEYIEANTQMIVEGTLTIDGTLECDGNLVLI